MRRFILTISAFTALAHCAPAAPGAGAPGAQTDSGASLAEDASGGSVEAGPPSGVEAGIESSAEAGVDGNAGGPLDAGDAAPPIAASPYVPAGYKLVLSDEFNGTTLDTGRWMTQYPCGCTKLNDEIEHYTNDGSNLHLKNGTMVIEADQDLSSGVFTGQASFKYGYFELRAQMGVSQGAWPAYWLTSDSRWPPEWDIFEVVSTPLNVYQTPHPVSGDTATCEVANNEIAGLVDVNTGFHIYGFQWTETDITWWIDGKQTQHCTVDSSSSDDFMWIQHNVAIGGSWPGNPDSTTSWPLTLTIDYSRVYQDATGQINMHAASGNLVDPESPQ
jgi:beta-glucanase (GH16 family)